MCGNLQDWSGDELAGFILKTYQNGNIDWSKIVEAEGVDRLPLTKIIQNSYGEYIVCGTYMEDYENQYQPEREIYVAKLDEEGNINNSSISNNILHKKNLLITTNITGQKTQNKKGFQLHIYDDGTVEKNML